MNIGDKVYRYESHRGYNKTYLTLEQFTITELTPCGYWIRVSWQKKGKWINATSKRKFAYPTKKEALISYRFRKLAFMRHAERAIKYAEHDLSIIETEGQKVFAQDMVPGKHTHNNICSIPTKPPQTLDMFNY